MKTDENITYHVRYKPNGLDEWWDWKKMPTEEEAIEQFKAYPARVENSHVAHLVITTTTVTEETVMYL